MTNDAAYLGTMTYVLWATMQLTLLPCRALLAIAHNGRGCKAPSQLSTTSSCSSGTSSSTRPSSISDSNSALFQVLRVLQGEIRFNITYHYMLASIAQWICLRFPSSSPALESRPPFGIQFMPTATTIWHRIKKINIFITYNKRPIFRLGLKLP